MAKLRIGLLNKKRGNFAIQTKFAGADGIVDETDAEVEHHERALTEAGYSVRRIRWGPNFVKDLQDSRVDLVFNVSSLVEAAILEELEIPYVGSDTFTIAVATDYRLKAESDAVDTGLPDFAGYAAPTSDIVGVERPVGCAIDIGAYEFVPTLTLHGAPADQSIHLTWTVNTTLPVTSTWQIDYQSQTGTLYTPITAANPTRAYTLTGLTNYTWYTVTLNGMLESSPFLTDTVRVKPTNIFVYLPLVLKES